MGRNVQLAALQIYRDKLCHVILNNLAFFTRPFKTTTILQQSIKVKVVLGAKIVDLKIFLDRFVSHVFIYCRGENAT